VYLLLLVGSLPCLFYARHLAIQGKKRDGLQRSASVMNWTPSPKQKDDAVTPAFLDIVESCSQLQKQVDCPDEYVQSLLRRIADTWAS